MIAVRSLEWTRKIGTRGIEAQEKYEYEEAWIGPPDTQGSYVLEVERRELRADWAEPGDRPWWEWRVGRVCEIAHDRGHDDLVAEGFVAVGDKEAKAIAESVAYMYVTLDGVQKKSSVSQLTLER